MDDILEAVKIMVEPTVKLLDMTQAAVGKLYDPFYVRKMADAKSYEISRIAECIRENPDLPMKYEGGSVTIDATNMQELAKRAESRMAYQEIVKQQNIEKVVGQAYCLLEGKDKISNVDIDLDWINSFFDSVANISMEKMQVIWSNLLAGEVLCPGTFSRRTLDVLKKMSSKEAQMFQDIAPYILRCKGDDQGTYTDCFLHQYIQHEEHFGDYSIPYYKIATLMQAGIIQSGNDVLVGFYLAPGKSETIYNAFGKIVLYNNGTNRFALRQRAYVLTESGKQLLGIIMDQAKNRKNHQYLQFCIDTMKNDNDGEMMNTDQIIFEII